ncbi:uncharacterized protein [Clytia hemisphaerica]|uniref:uncharacterized protein n=1 Tax=Clytia hemisphaerica TaxID=252671 RepID=UPI0034D71096
MIDKEQPSSPLSNQHSIAVVETICKRRKSVAATPQRKSGGAAYHTLPRSYQHSHSDLSEIDQRFTDVITHGSPKSRRFSVPSKLLSQHDGNHHHHDNHAVNKIKKNGVHQLSNVSEVSSTEDLRRQSYLLQSKLQDVTHSSSMPSSPLMSRNRRKSHMSPHSSPIATRKTNKDVSSVKSNFNQQISGDWSPDGSFELDSPTQWSIGNGIQRSSPLVTKNTNGEQIPRRSRKTKMGDISQNESIEVRSLPSSPLAINQINMADAWLSRETNSTKSDQSESSIERESQSNEAANQNRSKTTSAEILCNAVKRRMRKISASAENLNEMKELKDKRIKQLKDSKTMPNSTSLDNIHFVSLAPHPKSIAQLHQHSSQSKTKRFHRSLENLISTSQNNGTSSNESNLETNEILGHKKTSPRRTPSPEGGAVPKTLANDENLVTTNDHVNEVRKRRQAARQKLKQRQNLLNGLNKDIKIANRVLRNLRTRSMPLLDKMDINFEIPYEFIQAVLNSNNHGGIDDIHGHINDLIV